MPKRTATTATKPAANSKPKKTALGYKFPEHIPSGFVIKDTKKQEWCIHETIGTGGFGEIYSASDAKQTSKLNSTHPYAIKIEPKENGPLYVEMHFYMRVAKAEDIEAWKQKKKLKSFGMPVLHGSGSFEYKSNSYRFLVTDKLGRNLNDVLKENNNCFPRITVLQIGVQVMGKRKEWKKEAMIEAINAVREKRMGYKKAVKAFEVPRSTLKDYVKSGIPAEECVFKKIGRKPFLTEAVEKLLVEYCLEMERNFYGLTLADLKRMAYQLAIRNNLPHPFSAETGTAGRKWQRLFLKRHPQLSLRKPQNLSMARVQGFTRDSVNTFFSILKEQLEKINFDPSRLFNVDETGITVVQHKTTKILTTKGKKGVHKLSSAERGATTTVVTCMSAAGQFVPPMLIFPQKQWQVELLDGAPPGSIGGVCESGWITAPLFSKWFEHFITIVSPRKDKPVVLVLDGHYSHTRNIQVIDRARETGVLIVCLPPHSTAKMQPLDVSFMFPLKTYYAKAVENWLSNNPNRIVRKLQVSSLFREAYIKAATQENAINGFRKTGLYPFNPDVFQDIEFIVQPISNQATSQLEAPSSNAPVAETLVNSLAAEQNSTASVNSETITSSVLTPKEIKEVPIISPSSSNRRGSALLVTGTPHKEKIQEAEEKKRRTELIGKSSKRLRKTLNLDYMSTQPSTSTSTSRKPLKRSSSKSESLAANRKIQKKKKQCVESSSDDETDVSYVSTDNEDSDDDDVNCQFCQKPFSGDSHGQKWISCTKCFLWCHELCTTCKIGKRFICDNCSVGKMCTA